jgi:hypothetical protein
LPDWPGKNFLARPGTRPKKIFLIWPGPVARLFQKRQHYCYGTLVSDTLKLAGLTINNQTFGAATKIDEVFGYFPIDGILGLGWPAISKENVTPPFQNLMPQLDAGKKSLKTSKFK